MGEDAEEYRIQVLLVDDEPDFLEYSAKRLGARGMDVQTANDGIAALEILERESFDVVILDVAMPGLDGHVVRERILKRWPDQLIIMLTGHGTIAEAVDSMRFGVADYLTKPVLSEDLAKKIRSIVRHKH